MRGGKTLVFLKPGSGIYKGGHFNCLHCSEMWAQERSPQVCKLSMCQHRTSPLMNGVVMWLGWKALPSIFAAFQSWSIGCRVSRKKNKPSTLHQIGNQAPSHISSRIYSSCPKGSCCNGKIKNICEIDGGKLFSGLTRVLWGLFPLSVFHFP